MSSDLAISARGLGKYYKIPTAELRPNTVTEAALRRLRHPLQRSVRETFWALQDIDFDISAGEAVGVIGRNGAGKSTLLKILSRITEPSAGEAHLHGRVGSLLEVGTGFHPELTGRENIFLNGSILGMRRREITRQFDAIVDFSGVEHFLDLPVKRYSSGMQVRLAFAVAAHLEPEILVVDEVLAVGDAEFQKKCLGKMGDVARLDERTILFVSHNMAAIEALCSRCIYLEQGHVAFDGSTADAISRYLSAGSESHESAVGVFDLEGEPGNERGLLRRLRVLSNTGVPVDSVRMGDGLTLIVEVDGVSALQGSEIGIEVRSQLDQLLFSIGTNQKAPRSMSPRGQTEEIVFELDRMPLVPGSYWLTVGVWDPDSRTALTVERAASINVIAADIYNSGWALWQSVVYGEFEWELRPRQLPPAPASNGSNGRQRDDAAALNGADGADEASLLNP
jgi:lipopolysaccharide transport system ATP-binding protein